MKTHPLRILQVLPALDHGGVEQVVSKAALAVRQAGHQSFVASHGGKMSEALKPQGITLLQLPLHRRDPFSIRQNAKALRRFILSEKIDIIHAHSRAPAHAAQRAVQGTACRFVTTYHSAYSEKNFLKRRYNRVMAEGKPVIAISRYIKNLIIERYNLPEEAVRILYNGTDTEAFNPARISPERTEALRASWQLPDQALALLLPTRLSPSKGHLLLLEALRSLQRPDLFLIFPGDRQSHYAFEVRKAAAKQGLVTQLRMPGLIDDMPAALSAADLVVHPNTKPEGFGLALAEAGALEKPVIATLYETAAEIIIDRETGFLFPPQNARALAATLSEVLSLPEETKKTMGSAARKRICTLFSAETFAQNLMSLYESLADGTNTDV